MSLGVIFHKESGGDVSNLQNSLEVCVFEKSLLSIRSARCGFLYQIWYSVPIGINKKTTFFFHHTNFCTFII